MTDIGHGQPPDTDIGRDIGQNDDLETPLNIGLDIGPRFAENEIVPEQSEPKQSAEARSGVAERFQSTAMKGMAISAAALGVMGISNLMHVQPAEIPTPPIEPAPIVEQVEPGEVITQNDTQDQASESHKLAPVTSEIETSELEAPWWYDVPTISQRELQYNGRDTQFGCAPTAVSMVLDYWHAQDPANQTLSVQALLDANVTQGIFVGKGMSITNLHDEITGLGYDVAQDYADADMDTLKQHMAQGPVVTAVKLNMQTSGHNHSVVTGISEDNQVRINDPWTGDSRTSTWDEFSRSWGADFGISTKNHFTVIRPECSVEDSISVVIFLESPLQSGV